MQREIQVFLLNRFYHSNYFLLTPQSLPLFFPYFSNSFFFVQGVHCSSRTIRRVCCMGRRNTNGSGQRGEFVVQFLYSQILNIRAFFILVFSFHRSFRSVQQCQLDNCDHSLRLSELLLKPRRNEMLLASSQLRRKWILLFYRRCFLMGPGTFVWKASTHSGTYWSITLRRRECLTFIWMDAKFDSVFDALRALEFSCFFFFLKFFMKPIHDSFS